MKLSILFLLCGAMTASAAVYAPSANNLVPRVPGTDIGVVGGIPTSRTISGDANVNGITDSLESIDATGATSVSTDIQTAVNAASANTVVRLPAGTFRLDAQVTMGVGRDNITIRGAGESTIIDSHVSVPFYFGNGDAMSLPYGAVLADSIVSAGLTKASTTLTIADATLYSTGKLMLLRVENDTSLPMFSTNGLDFSAGQLVKITGKTSTTLTFAPALYSDYGAGAREAQCYSLENGFQVTGCGLEDLLIDCSSYTSGAYAGFSGQNLINCWLKGVRIAGIQNYPISLQTCLHMEIRRCYLDDLTGGGSNRSGILLNNTAATLVEDNIILDTQPHIEINQQSCNNVISRNYAIGTSFGIDINHGSGPQFNLVEGNWSSNLIADGYFGTTSYNTVFRNYFAGTMSLKRFSYNTEVVGNFMPTLIQYGYPNIGNLGSNGTADFPSDPWADWGMTATLTTRTSDSVATITVDSSLGQITNGFQGVYVRWGSSGLLNRVTQVNAVSGLVLTLGDWSGVTPGTAFPAEGTPLTVFTGAGGYQEIDGNAADTTTDKGNRYAHDNSLSTMGADTLPASLIYTSKPAWMTAAESELGTTFNLAAYDPITPTTPTAIMIPAGYRYENPPADVTAPTLTSATIPTGGTTLFLVHNESVVVGAGGNAGWAVTLSTGSATATYSSGSGSATLTYTLSSTVNSGTTGTVAYTQPGSGIEDNAGNDLATLSGVSITNNSTQGSPPPGGTATGGAVTAASVTVSP